MTNLSFNNAQKTKINSPHVGIRKFDAPFDQSLTFNRAAGKRRRNDSSEYLINISAILNRVTRDNLKSLLEITLVGTSISHSVGVWDTIFKETNYSRHDGCMFVANANYDPIPQQRVITHRHYLDMSMGNTRIHQNRVNVGDKLGVAIYDTVSRYTYVLIYDITHNNCLVAEKTDESEKARVDDAPALLPAINCRLEMLYRVNPLGEAEVVNVDENKDREDRAAAFVTHLVNSAVDIATAYPWKPHFTPEVRQFNREILETRLIDEIDQGRVCGYDDFVAAARDLYNAHRAIKIENQRVERQNATGEQTEGRKPKRKPHVLPSVEIVTLGNGSVFGQFKDLEGESHKFLFEKDSMDLAKDKDPFINNSDLVGIDLIDKSDIMVLSPDKFGENSILRYFTLNF